ncbi:hypothetical protein VTN77DRAFT_6048 [Rasamsonia byssochlamydoides]|uniref:uncharacterized protein n=1 Tax=Rasamsonia byssochlamydoides TaxID=89139 RepID=UPI003742CD74
MPPGNGSRVWSPTTILDLWVLSGCAAAEAWPAGGETGTVLKGAGLPANCNPAQPYEFTTVRYADAPMAGGQAVPAQPGRSGPSGKERPREWVPLTNIPKGKELWPAGRSVSYVSVHVCATSRGPVDPVRVC